MTKAKVIVFAGSTRKDSLNKKLARQAAKAAEEAGAAVTYIDLADYDMPLYDGDDEAASGLPPKAKEFKKLLKEHDGFLIASPEYNSAYSAVLKNAIDWASRVSEQGEPSLSAFTGKYAGIMSASPGALGGLRGLYALRELLQNINVTVLPRMQAVTGGDAAFNDDGSLKEERFAKGVAAIAGDLVKTLQKIKA
ncbi:MAG TPA: NAD(P)H-dependent oxidoreductase [Patescibacteria group bacterium]|nr:NAD(P)H-dependent oxidoreductase [Patescibacteria group bacterium]